MTPQEAYKFLDVSDSISDDELKTKYKELARKYHPDVFKEDPEKFKKINEAYQLVTDFRTNPNKYPPKIQNGGGFWGSIVDLGDIFFNGGDFFRNASDEEDNLPTISHIKITLNISFQESILGCIKDVAYNRNLKCSLCQGAGSKKTGNGCDKCDGFGRRTINNTGMIFQTSCDKCFGKNTKKDICAACFGKRFLNDKRAGQINVPPGTANDETLRLVGEGNYAGRHLMGDNYTDVFVHIKVEPYKKMLLKDKKDVYSEINISLLEALEGVTKEVETLYGDKEIIIKPQSKHSDRINIPKCGVKNTDGVHIIQLNVDYPTDITTLVGVLKDAGNIKL